MILIVIVAFLLILFKPAHEAHAQILTNQTAYTDTLQERIDFIEHSLKSRRYVPLHVLPNIRFDADFDFANERNVCFAAPAFVGQHEDRDFDCSVLCHTSDAAYFYVGPHDHVVVNGERLAAGGYCTTNSVPRNCNRETSVVLFSSNHWTCIAEDPRYFSGESNSVQVVGRQHFNDIHPDHVNKIVLWDGRLGRAVDVARNTFRTSWDEPLTEDGGGGGGDGEERRFTVRCSDGRDRNVNAMTNNPLNPLECLPNVCARVPWVHPTVITNYQSGECECGDERVTRVSHIDPNDPSSPCASIVDTVDLANLSHVFRVDCISMNTPIDQLPSRRLLCPADDFAFTSDDAYRFELWGSVPTSWTGLDEVPHRLWQDIRNRVPLLVQRSNLENLSATTTVTEV